MVVIYHIGKPKKGPKGKYYANLKYLRKSDKNPSPVKKAARCKKDGTLYGYKKAIRVDGIDAAYSKVGKHQY